LQFDVDRSTVTGLAEKIQPQALRFPDLGQFPVQPFHHYRAGQFAHCQRGGTFQQQLQGYVVFLHAIRSTSVYG